MAENKKSFILYADQGDTFENLPDDIAGKLIKLVFAYVKDKNPAPEDLLLKIAFEPIKQQLKRDLKDWKQKLKKRSEAGKKGGIKSGESRRSEANVHFASENEANEADNVIVNDIVIDNVNVIEINNKPDQLFKIEECLLIALRDERWVNKNNVKREDLEQFNGVLEGRGQYSKNPADYKNHYFNWVKDGRPGVDESGKNKSIAPPGQLAETVKAIREQRLNG